MSEKQEEIGSVSDKPAIAIATTKTESSSKGIVSKKETQLQTSQDLLKELGTLKMTDGFTWEDLQIPRTKLLQTTSEEITKQMEGFELGMIIENINNKPVPKNFIPVFAHKSYIQFNPFDDKDPNFDKDRKPGDLIFRARSLSDPAFTEEKRKQLEFGENGERPLIRTHFDYWCYFESWNYPVVLSLPITNKESKRTAKNFQTMFDMMQTKDTKYSLSSRRIDKDATSYFIYQISVAGKATEKELRLVIHWNKSISKNLDSMQENAYASNDESSDTTDSDKPF